MIRTVPALYEENEQEQAVARLIQQRTGHRVHELRVRVSGGGVEVSGYAFSYYARQLALSAVRELFDAAPIKLDISVVTAVRAE